jgi:hypothetical protein
VSRRITKDSVTSPFRAPFAEVRGPEGLGEVKQRVRGRGLRRAIGELVTCPFCVGQWVATAFVFGLVFARTNSRSCGDGRLIGPSVLRFGHIEGGNR